jgi:hypothetical protein
MVSQSAAPTTKVAAGGASGVVLGAPVAIIFIFVLQTGFHLVIPPEVAEAIAAVVAVSIGFATSYIVRPCAIDAPIPDPVKS